MEFKVFILLIALVPCAVVCYSAGAPDSVCSDGIPRHHVDPQKSAFPYNILVSKKQIKAGETIDITIKGKTPSDTIKGILVQARVGETPVGLFDVSPSAQYVQLLNCGNSKGVSAEKLLPKNVIVIIKKLLFFQSAVTHKKLEKNVSSISLKWTAPKGLSEKVQIVATVALNGGTFWVNQKSEVINVN